MAATAADRRLYKQHDAHWLENGQIMAFSNGNERPEGNFSTVERFTLAITPEGDYPIAADAAWDLCLRLALPLRTRP